jgi:hypothetical protein
MIDRRNFIGKMLAAGAGFFVLPPSSGGRIWKARRPELLRYDQSMSVTMASDHIAYIVNVVLMPSTAVLTRLNVRRFH